MADRPVHRRFKSARVLNLLRSDTNPREAASETTSPVNTSPSETSLTAVTHSRSAASERLAPIESTATSTIGQSAASSPTDRTPSIYDKLCPSGVASGSMSIEDSVRTFRVFEILRSGNTAATSKAIQDSKPGSGSGHELSGTTILHLAIQCADPEVVEYIITNTGDVYVNTQDREGNTPLHLAAQLGRGSVVKQLLQLPGANDAISNHQGRAPIDLARTPEIFQELQLARSLFIDRKVKEIHAHLAKGEYRKLEELLMIG